MKRLLAKYADEISVDVFGNVVAKKNGLGIGPSVMLVAHADEVGGVVNEVLPNGLLRMRKIGFVSETVLPATKVWVGEVPGVIGAKPAHLELPGEQGKVTPINQLHIDVGAASPEEVRRLGIDIGSPVSFAGELTELGISDRLCGRAIDDRVGCAILLELLREMKDTPAGDVYVVISVREETNMSGAAMVAAGIMPNFAVALDTVPADDIEPGRNKFAIGDGPVLQLIEGVQTAYVGTIIHPAVKAAIQEAAERAKVHLQLSAEVGYWTTDAAAIHTSGRGIPTGFVSIPRRYAHSPGEVVDINDVVDAVSLLASLVNNLSGIRLEFIDDEQ
ncbi:MAG: M42 family metallopeptidase [Bacillota bacterium]